MEIGERENLLITVAGAKVGNLSVIVVPEVHPTPTVQVISYFHSFWFSYVLLFYKSSTGAFYVIIRV